MTIVRSWDMPLRFLGDLLGPSAEDGVEIEDCEVIKMIPGTGEQAYSVAHRYYTPAPTVLAPKTLRRNMSMLLP